MRDKLKPLRNHSPKLFTASIDKMLFKQFPMGNDLSKQMVVAKIVNPFGFGNWYLLNSDPNDPDYIWAIVDYEIVDVEIGSVSRKELENEKLYSYNGDETTLQRDLNFTPVNAKKLYDGLLKGKYYGHGGTTKRPLHVIAAEIRADWKNVYFGAKPYLDAMSTMNSIDDNYGMDDGRSIVNYFLANASTWRGETAKRVKAELKEMAKYYHGGSVHKKKYSSGGIAGESARVKNLSDEFASDELKDKLRKAIGIEGDVLQETDTPVIAFAFTDYGGDFYDKIAIAYFSEYYPDNTLVEPTSYSGYNAFVFGKPAQDYIEQTENYLLGFEDMETLYYEAQRYEEEEAFDDFIQDLNDEKYLFDEDMVKDWLMQNRTGYYSMTTTGLDYSSSELTDVLLEQGLLIEDFGILLDDLSNDGYMFDDDELEQYIRENIEAFIALVPFDMYYEDIVSLLLKDGIISEEENYSKGGNLKKQEWVAIFQHQEKWHSKIVISVYANTEKEAIREAEMSRNSNGISKEYELVDIYTYSGNPPMGFAKGGKLTTEPKVGDVLIMKSNGKKGIVVKCGQDQCDVDFGYGDVYGIVYGRIKDGIIYDKAFAKGGEVGGGNLRVEKKADGKYYWSFTFDNGKVENSFSGFETSADAQRDFHYRSRYFAEGGNVGALTENEIKRINDTMEYYFYYLEDAKDYASRKNTDTKKLAKFVMYSGKISKEKENDVLKYITDRISTFAKGGSVNMAEWAAIFVNNENPHKFVKVTIYANSIGEAIQQAIFGALLHNMRDYDLVDVYVVKGGRRTDTNYSKGAGYAKGGKIGFKGLSQKVAKRYVGQKVAPKYQKEYGKTYDKAEAKEVGNKVAAKVYRAQLSNKKSVIDTKTK